MSLVKASGSTSNDFLSVILNDEYGITQPEAKLILFYEKDSNGKNILKLNRDNFEKIINVHQNAHKPLAIVSIVGATHKGKSFFLNYLLRRMGHLERAKFYVPENVDWMTSDLANGFTYGDLAEHRTFGWWMWSRPFEFVDAEGQAYDLFVVDTQGVFDRKLNHQERSIVVSLSLLLSSTLVYNLNNDINESHLESFGDFLNFGLITKNLAPPMESKANYSVFQNLFFLVRDWNNPGRFPYGLEGGRKYLQDVLEINEEQSETMKTIRSQLKYCFNSMKCSLLPHPDLKILEANSDNQGFQPELKPMFKKFLEETVEILMTSKEIPILKVYGNSITYTTFHSMVQQYVDIFNSSDIPKPETLYKVNIQVFNKTIIEKCLKLYKVKMRAHMNGQSFFEFALRDINMKCRQEALDLFDKSIKLGHKDDAERSKLELSKQISDHFPSIQWENAQRHKRNLEKAHYVAMNSFQENVDKSLKNVEFKDEESFDSLISREMSHAIEVFQSKFHFVECDEMNQEIATLVYKLHDKGIVFQSQNTVRYKEAQERRQKWELEKISFLSKTLERYATLMETETKDRHVTSAELSQIHERLINNILNPSILESPEKELLSEVKNEIRSKINVEFQTIQLRVDVTRKKIEDLGKTLVAEAAAIFESNMKELLDCDDVTFENEAKNWQKNSEQELNKSTSAKLARAGRRYLELLVHKLKNENGMTKAGIEKKRKLKKGLKVGAIVGTVVGGVCLSAVGLAAAPFLVPAAAGVAVAGWLAPAIVVGTVAAEAAIGAAAGAGIGALGGAAVGAGIGLAVGTDAKSNETKKLN